jgi:hypothetical protein
MQSMNKRSRSISHFPSSLAPVTITPSITTVYHGSLLGSSHGLECAHHGYHGNYHGSSRGLLCAHFRETLITPQARSSALSPSNVLSSVFLATQVRVVGERPFCRRQRGTPLARVLAARLASASVLALLSSGQLFQI